MPNALSSLKNLDLATHTPVAFSPAGELSWAKLLDKVHSLQQQVATIPQASIAIRHADGAELLACLLAIWRENKIAVLSASKAFLNTTAANTDTLLLGIDLAENDLATTDVDTVLVVFTSGSSGKPTAVTKTFAQLDAELALLERCWGNEIGESVFVSTVSRQHMYGLPFGLLWPVARGSAFYTETVNYSESLETLSDRFSIALISSPVQLDKLPNNLNWPKLKNSINTIFSAGAPLPEAAATRCAENLLPVIEIYGSTETGAVAWREQTKDPLWQCLPDINVSMDTQNQTLQIQSPCLPTATDAWFASADRVALQADQRFELLGRVDRICKIGAKRISLSHIERQLKNHPWVADAKCLLLEQRKSRLGAVIALTPDGRAALIDQGKLAINRQLNQSITAEVEAVAIPRYWRYLAKLPVDSQGKSATPILSSLFDPEQQPRLPEVLSTIEKLEHSQVELALNVPHNLFYFSGHFPGNPVLPGVVQIEWAQYFGRQYFNGLATFVRLEALKFQHIIQPEDPVTLQLEWDKTKSRLNFSFTNHSIKYSSGRIVFSNESKL